RALGRRGDLRAAEERAVLAAEVLDRGPSVGEPDPRVAARDGRRVHPHLAALLAPDRVVALAEEDGTARGLQPARGVDAERHVERGRFHRVAPEGIALT